ncbi:MAG: hypothetical protein WCC06_06405 [Candidatus Aminicenantales bacterium]
MMMDSARRFIALANYKGDIQYYKNYKDYEFVFLASHKIHPEVLLIDRKNCPETMEQLRRLHQIHPFQGILFGINPEVHVVVAAQVAEKLGLKRIIKNPYLVRDKYLMTRPETEGEKALKRLYIHLFGSSCPS